MQHINDIPVKEMIPGFRFRLVHGAQSSLSYVEIAKGSAMAEHQHPHEQTTFVLEGQLDMIIGGQPYTMTSGMTHVIPSNTPHSAFAATDVKVIDFFSPSRDEYR